MSLDQLTSNSLPAFGTGNEPRPRRSRTWLLPVGLLIGFLCILALLFGNRLLPAVEVKTSPVVTHRASTDEPTEKSTAAQKNVEPVAGKMLFQASGWIEPDPYVTYVPTLVNGVIDKVYVLEGQSVKKGELLATLVDDDAKLDLQEAEQKINTLNAAISAHCTGSDITQAELMAARKKIESAKARLAEASDHLARLENLPDGAVSRQEVVQARLAKTRQAAQVAEIKAEIPRLSARLEQIDLERVSMASTLAELETRRDRAKLAMGRTRIKAPIDGIVLHLHAAPGKKRMLNMDDAKSAVIVELYDPNKLQARVDVPLTEAAGLEVGQFVELTSDLLPDVVFKGRLTRITGEADLQRNTLQAKVSIIRPDPRLRPEMLIRGKFFSTSGTAALGNKASNQRLSLYVTEAALVTESSVWVVSPRKTAELRPIRLGNESRNGHRRVLDGLRSGEQVILPPHSDLKNGTRVTPIPPTSN